MTQFVHSHQEDIVPWRGEHGKMIAQVAFLRVPACPPEVSHTSLPGIFSTQSDQILRSNFLFGI